MMDKMFLSPEHGFVDDTEIDFGPGLNVFIGANGVGTSYLMDLIVVATTCGRLASRAKTIYMYDMLNEISGLFDLPPRGSGAEAMQEVAFAFCDYSTCVFDDFADQLSPRQATEFTRLVSDWCAKYDTQVICSTHTPGVLDALDLSTDGRDKLFALDFNTASQRVCRQVKPSPELVALNKEYPLSRLWPMGNIGGV
jgi:hypothetical protein